MARLELHGALCVVTGAAGGLGSALAGALAGRGVRLVLTDLDQSQLDRLSSSLRETGADVALARAADLTDADSVRALVEQVVTDLGAPDVVLNVAGISIWGSIDRLTEEHWRRTIEVNLLGPVRVLSGFAPAMIAAGSGHVVNVSSAAGLFGLPWHAAYSASKFGLRGVSEVLRFDLRRHGIGVSLVCPGAVATPLVDSLEVVGVDRSAPSVRRVERQFLRHAVSPERAAAAIVRGLVRRRYWIYTSADVRWGHYAQRWAPWAYEGAMRLLNRRLARAVQRAGADR